MYADATSREPSVYKVLSIIFAIILIIAIGIIIFLVLTKQEISKQQCIYNGVTYESGSSIAATDGCNSCSCEDGEVACTEMACVSLTPSPTVIEKQTLTPTPTITTIEEEGLGTKIYFAKPSAENDYDTLISVSRDTDKTGADLISYIINQFIAGPTATEKSAGATSVINLSGDSSCGGSAYKFSWDGDTINVKFCKTINFITNAGSGGSYSGMSLAANARIYKALNQSLTIEGISKLVLRQADDSCFAKDAGVNINCTD